MAKPIARRLILGAVLALVSSACSVSETKVPGFTGPSGLALSFAITATPDSIHQDGASQSSITVTARDANAKSIPGLAFRMDMFAGGQAVDYGTLSGKTLVTGSDGRASAVYTAPPAPPPGSTLGSCAPSIFSPALPGTCVTISATAISTGFTNGTNSETVVIHLVPVGVILPPADTPTPSFVITPTPVTTDVATNFDGSASCAGAATGPASNPVCSPSNNTIVSYSWGFGDGGAAMGRAVSHSYSAPGTYTVMLTVTNNGGKSASTSQTVTVAASALPTPAFVFSPSQPAPGQVVQFNASASKAVAGHSIVGYVWNFGDGATGGGQLTSHSYVAIGSYAVTLTVTDDAGQSATVNQSVNVQVPTPPPPPVSPTAKFTSSPTSPHTPPVTVFFDGSGSTTSNGAAINNYHWNFGDGTIISGPPAGVAPGGGTFQAPNHVYAATGGFTVNLTVTDTNNLSGSATGTVTVVP